MVEMVKFCILQAHISVLQSMFRCYNELVNLMLARNSRYMKCSWLCHEAHLCLTRHPTTFPLECLWHNMVHNNLVKGLTTCHRTVNFVKFKLQQRRENDTFTFYFMFQLCNASHKLDNTWQVVVSLWPSKVIPLWHLNVICALSVLLPPSKNPFGKLPGDPQLISFVHESIMVSKVGDIQKDKKWMKLTLF